LQTAQIADPDDWSPLGVVNRSEEDIATNTSIHEALVYEENFF
jgi:hypothetical protein